MLITNRKALALNKLSRKRSFQSLEDGSRIDAFGDQIDLPLCGESVVKLLFMNKIVDIIFGFGLSATTHPAWPGFDFEQDRWSTSETDQNLISCREDDDRPN